MKRTLLMLAALVASTQAHATKARLRALNQNAGGSYFILDSRNIFLNPALVAESKDSFNLEWGQQDRPGTADGNADAEGGFSTKIGVGRAAVQLGRVTDFDANLRVMNSFMPDVGTAVVGGNFAEGQNNVDVMYAGGGEPLRWGGGVAISRSETALGAGNQATVQSFDFRGGISNKKFEAFGSLLLGAKSESELGNGISGKFDEKFGLFAGGSVFLGSDKKAYGSFRYDNFEVKRSDGAAKYDGSGLQFLVGFANWREISHNGRFFYSAELNYVNAEADDKVASTDEEFSQLGLPLTMGLEADANSWLRMRASVRQNILLGHIKATVGGAGTDKWENAPNSTSVAGGVGTNMNNFNFDAALVQALGDDHGRVEVSMNFLF